MGGVSDALADVGKEAVEDLSHTAVAKSLKDTVVNMGKRVIGMDHEFNKSDAGKDLKNLTMNYLQNFDRATEAGIKVNMGLPKEMQTEPHILKQQARNTARALTFGHNDAVPAFLLHQAAKAPNMNPVSAQMHAQNLADFTALILHDTETRPTYRPMNDLEKQAEAARVNTINVDRIKNQEPLEKPKTSVYSGQSAPFSTLKKNVAGNVETPVKLKQDAVYIRGNKIERILHQYGQKIIFPFAAVPHLTQPLTTAISTPLLDLSKAMADEIGRTAGGTDFAKISKFAQDAGIFGATHFDIYSANYYGARGKIAQLAGDNIGRMVYKMTHNPLFDAVRNEQLAGVAAAGYHTAIDMAQRLFESGGKDKRAMYELEKMGINQQDIMMQKGQLNKEQIEKALWRFTDSKMFLHSELQRSFYGQSHPFFRIATMYHTYVTRMARLLAEEAFYKPLKAGYGLIPGLQAMTVLGVAFPLAGMINKNLSALVKGDWDDVKFKQDFEDLMFQNGPKAAFAQLINDYTHMGVLGITNQYIRGSSRFAMANAMTGPIGSTAAGIGDAVGSPVAQEYEKHISGTREKDPNWKPLARTLIEDQPFIGDNIGKIAAHAWFPTQKEEKERAGSKSSMKFKSKSNKHFHFKKSN